MHLSFIRFFTRGTTSLRSLCFASAPLLSNLLRFRESCLASVTGLGAFVFLLMLACSACSQKPKAVVAPEKIPDSVPKEVELSEAAKVKGTRLIGRIPAGSYGPHLALGTKARLAVWAESETQRPMWESLLIPHEGGPAASQKFDQLGSGLEDFEVIGLDSGDYLLLSRRNVGGRDVLEAHLLDQTGAMVEGARTISEASEIIWSKALSVENGALITFAVQEEEGASIYSYHYRSSGRFIAPILLQTDVVAWQVAQGNGRAYLASVSKAFTNRLVSLMPLDSSARQVLPQVEVTNIASGALDIDIMVGENSVFYAYSEAQEFGARIIWGAVGIDGGSDHEPRPLTLPRGNQQLVALSLDAKRDRLLILWEEPALSRQAEREILGSVVSHSYLSSPQFSFATGVQDPLLPEVTFDGTAFQFILEQPPSLRFDEAEEAQGQTQIALASYNPTTSVSKTRVPRIEQLNGSVADMAWDVSCEAGNCELLLAKSGSPSLVFSARLNLLPEVETQIDLPETWAQPQVKSVEVVQKVSDLRGLKVSHDKAGSLLSWVTEFDSTLPYKRGKRPAPDGRYAPERAHLETLSIPETKSGELSPSADVASTEQGLQQSVTLSYRARSLGGVSMSEASKTGKRAIAWAALDGRDPQLFLTIVNNDGTKQTQKMLTHSPGEVTDVSVTRVARGYLVLWLDSRGDSPLLYSMIVDEKLRILRREKPLTVYSENPTGLVVRRIADGLLVVWSDTDGAGKLGHGDLFSLSLDGKTGELISPAHRLFATNPHSHSPALAAHLYAQSSAATLVWIESTLKENGLETSMIRRAEIDLAGRVVGAPDDFFFESLVSNFAVYCEANEYCDIVFPLITGQRARLWAISLDQEGAYEPHPLYGLTRPMIQMVMPTLLGSSLYYVDQIATGQNHLMKLTLNHQ